MDEALFLFAGKNDGVLYYLVFLSFFRSGFQFNIFLSWPQHSTKDPLFPALVVFILPRYDIGFFSMKSLFLAMALR
jgi:hypothetical protein